MWHKNVTSLLWHISLSACILVEAGSDNLQQKLPDCFKKPFIVACNLLTRAFQINSLALPATSRLCFFLFNSICIMLMLDVIMNHLWPYGKRGNFVIVSLQGLSFVLGFFIHVITLSALLTPADMQSHLNYESETVGLVAAGERNVFCCLPVTFISPVFRHLSHT